MATRTFTCNDGNDRLIISTILNHLIFFHEAGMEFTTEKRRKKTVVWWNPSTWGGGFEWVKSNRVTQPSIDDFIFIQGRNIERNPADFSVSNNQSVGYHKSSCVYFGYTYNSSDSPATSPTVDIADLGVDARSVNNVEIRFTYDGVSRTLRHSDG